MSTRAFAVKVVPKRRPVFSFSGFDVYHHFRNDAIYGLYNLLNVQKTGKREVVLGQPLPQTLYMCHIRSAADPVQGDLAHKNPPTPLGQP